MKTIRFRTPIAPPLVLLFVLFIFAAHVSFAQDESAALRLFQQTTRTADMKLVKDEFKATHPNPPSKEEVNDLVTKLTRSAVAVMDEGAAFETRFPKSSRLFEVRLAVVKTLATIFGQQGLPVPKDRAPDIEVRAREFLTGGGDSVGLNMVLCRVAASLPIKRQRAMYEELSQGSIPEPARTLAKTALQKLGRLGAPLDLSFTAMDGHHISVADLRGKVVLVDFWSTTCLPCLRELPDLRKLHKKYKPQGLELIGISLDTDRQALQRFIRKEEISWPQYFDPAGETNPLAVEYGIQGIPVVWLVDRHGVLRDLNGRDDQETKIKSLLEEP